MKIPSGLAALVALPALLCFAPAPPRPASPSPPEGDIQAEKWVNLIGETPTLETLKGRAVILHFFGTEKDLEKASWPILRQFDFEYASKGLVILSFPDAGAGNLSGYFDSFNVPFPVGIGGTSREAWGVSDPFYLIFLDRNGEVFWRGPPNGLWNGKLLKGLKGAKRLGDRGVLALHLSRDPGKAMAKVASQCAEGELGAALKSVEAVTSNERSAEENRADTTFVLESIEAHVKMLMEQIEVAIKHGEVLEAVAALDVLAKELKRHPFGEAPAARLEEVRADPVLQKEIEAAELYEKLIEAYYRRGLQKNRERFDKLIEDYGNTRAAQKTRNLLQGH